MTNEIEPVVSLPTKKSLGLYHFTDELDQIFKKLTPSHLKVFQRIEKERMFQIYSMRPERKTR